MKKLLLLIFILSTFLFSRTISHSSPSDELALHSSNNYYPEFTINYAGSDFAGNSCPSGYGVVNNDNIIIYPRYNSQTPSYADRNTLIFIAYTCSPSLNIDYYNIYCSDGYIASYPTTSSMTCDVDPDYVAPDDNSSNPDDNNTSPDDLCGDGWDYTHTDANGTVHCIPSADDNNTNPDNNNTNPDDNTSNPDDNSSTPDDNNTNPDDNSSSPDTNTTQDDWDNLEDDINNNSDDNNSLEPLRDENGSLITGENGELGFDATDNENDCTGEYEYCSTTYKCVKSSEVHLQPNSCDGYPPYDVNDCIKQIEDKLKSLNDTGKANCDLKNGTFTPITLYSTNMSATPPTCQLVINQPHSCTLPNTNPDTNTSDPDTNNTNPDDNTGDNNTDNSNPDTNNSNTDNTNPDTNNSTTDNNNPDTNNPDNNFTDGTVGTGAGNFEEQEKISIDLNETNDLLRDIKSDTNKSLGFLSVLGKFGDLISDPSNLTNEITNSMNDITGLYNNPLTSLPDGNCPLVSPITFTVYEKEFVLFSQENIDVLPIEKIRQIFMLMAVISSILIAFRSR